MTTTKTTTSTAYRVTLTARGESTESRHRSYEPARDLATRAARKIAHPAAAASFTRELERERALSRPVLLRIPGVAVLTVEAVSVAAGDSTCPWNVHPSDARCSLPRGHASSCAVVVLPVRERRSVVRGIIRPTPPDEHHDFRPVVASGLVVAGCSCGWDELSGRMHRTS